MPTRKPAPDGVTIVGYDPAFPIEKLKPFHKNPRRGNVDLIRDSIRANGQYKPITVNKGTKTKRPNEILAGNHTYAAVKAEGRKTIAVAFVDVDEQEAARIVLVDNKASDVARNDSDVLKDLVVSLDDLEGSGFTDEDLAKMMGAGDDPDTTPQLDAAYAVIIDCEDEHQQLQLLADFEDQGLNARPLMM